MKKVKLTTEWLANWSSKRRDEVADGVCRGLVARCGPSGVKTFYRFTQIQDPVTGTAKRQRVKLGRWALDGGRGAFSLSEARDSFLEAQGTKRAAVDGTDEATVQQLAHAYNRDVLSNRERAAEAWNVVRVHIVEAKPDPKRPPFGDWPALAVRAKDIAELVRYAKEPRTVGHRRLGGRGAARVVLRELKAVFAHAVNTGSMESTPAGALKAESFGLRATDRERVLDAQELKALFAALDLTALLNGTAKPTRLSPTVRLALGFQLYVPLRSQSLIGARWEEVDFQAARWTVPVSRLKLRKDQRQSARPFVVPLAPTALAILQKLRDLAGDSPWVLASPVAPAKHVEAKALIHALSRLFSSGRLAFSSKVTVHDLRRCWRTLAQDTGVDDVVAEHCLGHARPLARSGFSSIADVYGRSQRIEKRAEAAVLVETALDRIRLGAGATVVPLGACPSSIGARVAASEKRDNIGRMKVDGG